MSQIKNFLLKKLGIRATAGNKDNSLSVSNKSIGSNGSSSSRSRRKNATSSSIVECLTNDSGDGIGGGMSNNEQTDIVDFAFSTIHSSGGLALRTDQSPTTNGNGHIPIPRRGNSPNIQFSEKTKFQSEKSILSASEKSIMSDILSDDSSVFSLGTDLTMHDKKCSDKHSAKNAGKLPFKDTSVGASIRSSASHSSLTSVLSVSTTTVATSEVIPTRHIDLTDLPRPSTTVDIVTDPLDGDDKTDMDDLSPTDGGIVSVLFAGKTKKGVTPTNPSKPNQDAFFMKHDPNTSSLIIACFDGHGQYGHDVSRYCKKYLEKYLCLHPTFSCDVKRAVMETIVHLDKSMLASPSLNTMFSGTTMSLIIIRGTLVYVANIGDSRVVLGHSGRPKPSINISSSGSTTEEERESNNPSRQQSPSNVPSYQPSPLMLERKSPTTVTVPVMSPPRSTLTSAWNAFNMSKVDQLLPSLPNLLSNTSTKSNIITLPLSIDHKPDNAGEKQRIERNGGRVKLVQGTSRVYLTTDDIPGLAMSRSLGDFIAHSVGVSSVPDFFEYDLNELHSVGNSATAQLHEHSGRRMLVRSVLLIGTDGIYDMISNEAAIAMAFNHWGDPAAATEAIVDHTREKWFKRWKLADDTTICIVNLEHTTSIGT